MPITEEQRERAESNRLAALAKRKVFTESVINQQQQQHNPWKLFKCRKLSSDRISTTSTTQHSKPPPLAPIDPNSDAHLGQKFRVRLEICSPDSFSLTPEALRGFIYAGEEECLRRLNVFLADVMPSHYTQNHGGGKACVYKLRDYDAVLSCLKNYKVIEIEKIPFGTLHVVQRLSHSFETGRWEPIRPEHFTDEKVDELIGNLPRKILDVLLPFQLDGLRFGLRRGGRCLIADEMGLGKTLQAIAIAGCFMNEGPILVVCPAILRFSWAEELERWLPSCLPSEIHLVFGHQNNPAYLTRCPRVVVISFKMLHHLGKSMLEREWALLIVDESHHVRCSKKKSEPNEIKAVLDVAAKVKRMVLLSGTPSLSRPYDIFHQINMLWPGLLGQSKYDFAKTYCAIKHVPTSEGKSFQDFSRGTRLEELNMLLTQTVMIRRLKKHVMEQLPPKRRQIIRILLKKSNIVSAKGAFGTMSDNASEGCGSFCKLNKLSYQELGIAKLPAFREWLSIHPLITESDGVAELDVNCISQKMIIFAHHHKVLDGVQELIFEKGIGFVRIDGNTLPRDRQSAVRSFQSSNEVKIAIIGVTAGGVGLDFSSAQNVVFLELPQSSSLMLQAEDRAHRRGQTNAVNIYIFCAKDTVDERHWQYLNKSLHRVSSTTNGKYDAVPEIPVDGVSYLESTSEGSSGNQISDKASYAKLSAITEDSCTAKNMQPFENHDEAAGTLIDRSEEHPSYGATAVQTDDFHLKVELASTALDKELYNYIAESESNSDGGISSSKLDKGNGSEHEIEKEQNPLSQTKETYNHVPALGNEADETFSNQVYSLRFEVSKYTGRIHLYSCILGTDPRPQPLFENFRPEEIESFNSLVANNNNESATKPFKGIPPYRHALLAFIKEWNKLRPIERRKLVGKTLQLPLSIELCYLNENINHSTEGLLKGGSKRRMTPWFEISYPLPSGAVWKNVNLSSSYGKKEKQYTQGWTLMDEPLCKLCQTPCKGSNAKTPEFFEDLFCNLSCYEEYRIRTSSRSLRQELFQIEYGVCTNCQLDCHKLVKTIQPLTLERRREYIEKVAPNLASRKKLFDKLVNAPSEGNAWHADHIIPVYRGGGECRLENMRTLCVACHYDVTAAQRAERRATWAKARAQLKIIMNNLKSDQKMESDSSSKGQGHSEDMVEDELLVKVPGSAYSVGKDTNPGTEVLNKFSKDEE
ncbi:DNA annealing helicase and endonuclease ZRANB3 [Ricinus communis]|uniref:DNA annealing helicase and endonuclease ZRANB3 n=1 Tax=Ricinus communis TaxID=3988 RepID=UPI00077259F4|nr:DNA annealing helicase and endonuclease ZRANB3 [Ricinus communis]|eukprot:XP_015571924.1 DNA annealing helicase and endonuclease ZRANB3 [Ricinus communis]